MLDVRKSVLKSTLKESIELVRVSGNIISYFCVSPPARYASINHVYFLRAESCSLEYVLLITFFKTFSAVSGGWLLTVFNYPAELRIIVNMVLVARASAIEIMLFCATTWSHRRRFYACERGSKAFLNK